jgi:glycerol-3-phosphate dehydrogenase subunit C
MVAWKKRLAAERGVRWRDRLLIMTDMIGKLGSATALITNSVLGNRFVRRILDRVMGIHQDRRLLHFSRETFPQWFGRRAKTTPADLPVRKVALFASCLVNYQVTDVGKAAVQVLEKNGVHVVVPQQSCCGMPSLISAIPKRFNKPREAMSRHCFRGYSMVTMSWSRPPVVV